MNWTRFLILLAVVSALVGCGRVRQKTYHHVETDDYTLTVSGVRLLKDKQAAAVPKDTARSFGDTVRIHDALMYFRLSSSSPVTESGDYYADVLFWVESLT